MSNVIELFHVEGKAISLGPQMTGSNPAVGFEPLALECCRRLSIRAQELDVIVEKLRKALLSLPATEITGAALNNLDIAQRGLQNWLPRS